jgi:hypothetical protein
MVDITKEQRDMLLKLGADKTLCIRIKKTAWLVLKKCCREHDKSMNLLINEIIEKFTNRKEGKNK